MAPILLLSGLFSQVPVQAFAPYTHHDTAMPARADAIDNGKVTIAGREYPVNASVVAAIRDFPSYYRAGVVGPDGFPDLIMGQSVVHPSDTGRWLAYLLKHAWAAQDPASSYTADEKSQILAFTYGYLTHAAGDMWAHTLVNQFTGGPFPNVGTNMLTNTNDLSNALRHELVEFYMEDATPGKDGNTFDNRKLLTDGDISDDSTPARPLDAPIRFIYETLVRHNSDEPTSARGAALDFFFNLRSQLASLVIPLKTGESLAKFAGDYEKLKTKFEKLSTGDCSFGPGIADIANDVFWCPIALLELGFDVAVATVTDFANLVTSALHDSLALIANAYLNAWIDDIDQGLQHWGELGLGISRGIFDPQARRDLQNDPGADGCGSVGPDSLDIASARGSCEDKISVLGTVMHQTEDFRNDHLLSMLGLPDAVGGALSALSDAADAVSALLGPIANPLRETKAQISEAVKTLVEDAIKNRFGIDIPELEAFLKSPSSKMDVQFISITTPLGTKTINLFQATDHALLDHYLGIAEPYPTSPGGGLGDSVVYDPAKFAAWQDTVTLAKLLLLDGPTLDQLLSDLVGHTIHLYGNVPNANIMTTPLSTTPSTELNESAKPDEWLRLIDGDHAWRKDGLPIFTDNSRFEGPSGGNGNFPLWKSCILRTPVFRTLFKDWENENFVPASADDSANFPNYGDLVGPDPNDPNPPTSTLTIVGANSTNAGSTYVGSQTALKIQAHDGFWADSEIKVTANIQGPAGTVFAGSFPNGGTVQLTGPDGSYQVSFHASDPCGQEAAQTQTFVLDSTAPVTTVTPAPGTQPAGLQVQLDVTTAVVNPGNINFAPVNCYNSKGLALNLHATDTGSGVAKIEYTTLTRRPFQPAVTTSGQSTGADLTLPITADGVTVVTYHATDNLGNQEAAKKQIVFVSQVASIACTAPKPVLPATFPRTGTATIAGTLTITTPQGTKKIPFSFSFPFSRDD